MDTMKKIAHNPDEILYGMHQSPFGWCVLGLAKEGVCYLSFLDTNSDKKARMFIREKWPGAKLKRDDKKTSAVFKKLFSRSAKNKLPPLVVKGTDFQIKVWKALLSIPRGKTASYTDIARLVKAPKAVRAVGSACGKNSIAYLIPCHRVLASTGKIGGYRWGIARKEAMLAWEKSR